MSAAKAAKGKLELILDEFTEVHGTVLMGMHKELQTLKQEVDKRVEERISAVLTKIDAADAVLKGHLDGADQVAANLDGKEKRAAAAISAAKKDALVELGTTRDAVLAEGVLVRKEFGEHSGELQSLEAEIRDSLEKRHQAAIQDVQAAQESWELQAKVIKQSLQSIETETRESLEARHRAAMESLDARQAGWKTQSESIGDALRDLGTALHGELQAAKRDAVAAILDQQHLWNAAAKKTVNDFAGFRDTLNTLCFELECKLADQQRAIAKSLADVGTATQEEMSRLRDEGVGDIQALHSEVEDRRSEFEHVVTENTKRQADFQSEVTRSMESIGHQRSEFECVVAENRKRQADFQSDVTMSMERISLIQQEHQTKMSAALSVADKLNTESRGLLNEVVARTERLSQRELMLQKRTRQVVIGVGISVIATLCAWIWLTLPH
jgi:hypothetical protein